MELRVRRTIGLTVNLGLRVGSRARGQWEGEVGVGRGRVRVGRGRVGVGRGGWEAPAHHRRL